MSILDRSPRRRRRRFAASAGFHALAAGAALLFLAPMLWVLAASLRHPGLPAPAGIEWLPTPPAWVNYARVFDLLPLGRYAANSLLVAGLAIPLTVVVASWAGFAMAQLPARPRHGLLALAVVVRMIPLTALWLTRFLVLKELRLVDSLLALLAPVTMGSFLDPGARPRGSRVFLSEIPHIRAVPVAEGWVDVEDLAGEELARAFYGRASVDEVIATALRRAAPFFAASPEPARSR